MGMFDYFHSPYDLGEISQQILKLEQLIGAKNNIKSIENCEFLLNSVQDFHNHPTVKNKFHSIKGVWKFCYGTDSYEQNIKRLTKQPEDWYYRHNDVNYTINSHGYRTKEFDEIDWQNSIVIFGCSFVFGYGVDDKHTISSFLQDLTGIPVINMGIPGSSIGFALHNSLMLYKKYRPPKMVIYSWTSMMRNLIYTSKSFTSLIVNKDDIQCEDAYHCVPFNLINVELIRNLWENKCPMYEYTLFPETAKVLKCDSYGDYPGFPEDYARDLEHYGPNTNKKIAEWIYDKIKEYLN